MMLSFPHGLASVVAMLIAMPASSLDGGAKFGERPSKVRVALQPRPATHAAHVAGKNPAADEPIDAFVVVRVDAVEQSAPQLVRALRCRPCVETIKTGDRGGAHRRVRL
jgi:hypothetical protein